MRNAEADLIQSMQRFDEAIHKEMEREQVSHPLDLYQPGSERLEKLYAAMDEAARFSWPTNGYQVNL